MLAHTYLAVTAGIASKPWQQPLAPITLVEVERLLAHLVSAPFDRAVTWAWSHWCRRHQYRARQAHYQRRQTKNYEMRLDYLRVISRFGI